MRRPRPDGDPDVLRDTAWLSDERALVQLPSLQSLAYLRAYLPEDRGSTSGAGRARLTYAGFGDPILGRDASIRGSRSAGLAPIAAEDLFGDTDSRLTRSLVDPDLLRGLSRLPGTRAEVQEVGRSIPFAQSDLFVGADMTEAAIRKTDLANVSVLHLATHGVTSAESGGVAEPGLVFTPPRAASFENDGYLSASEVVELDLASALWVILSACNTAAGSDEESYEGLTGLARSFFLAGAPSLLVSHWPVFDDVAARLSADAVRLNDRGRSKAEALQQAIRKVRDDPAMDAYHPAVWAPFTLVGEGR